MSLVSIVLLNYNSGSFIGRVVDSIAAQDHRSCECIVVDNASTDDSLTRILRRFDEQGMKVEVVRSPTNGHFAAGMNMGISMAKGDVVVALNSDVCLSSGYVSALLARKRAGAEAGIGAFCGAQYRWDWDRDRLTPQYTGHGVRLMRHLGVSPWRLGEHDERHLLGPSGCAPAFARTALEAIRLDNGDYFDTRFVAFGEDIDLFLRLRLHGFRPMVLRGLRFWHIGSASYSGAVSSVLAKEPSMIGQVLANKWRIWRRLPSTRDRALCVPLVLLYQISVAVRSARYGGIGFARDVLDSAIALSKHAFLEEGIAYPSGWSDVSLFASYAGTLRKGAADGGGDAVEE